MIGIKYNRIKALIFSPEKVIRIINQGFMLDILVQKNKKIHSQDIYL